MRILDNKTGVLNVQDIHIETSLQKLGVHLTGISTPAKKADATITVVIVSKRGGTRNLITKSPIYDLLRISAQNEGFFRETDDTLKGTIDITENGGLRLDTDEYLSITVENLELVNSLSLNTIDSPIQTDKAINYDPFNVQGLRKEINLIGVSKIALNQSKTAKITIDYDPAGEAPPRSVQYDATELAYINDDINDITSVTSLDPNTAGEVFAGAHGFLLLDVTDAIRMQLEPTDLNPHTVYLIRSFDPSSPLK